MRIIQWNTSYSVGHPLLDKQHERLLDLINRLFEAIQDKGSFDQVQLIAEEVVEHGRIHFDTEERIMAEAGFPGMHEHARVHRQMLEEAQAHCEEVMQGSHSAAVRLLNFLKEWILEHMSDYDRAYMQYLNSNSLS